MPQLQLQDIHLTFGDPPLFEGLNFIIEPGERICLMGRNGSGKTTLLKLICGRIEADQGTIIQQPHLKTAWLPQEVPQDIQGKVQQIVRQGLEMGVPQGDVDESLIWQNDQKVNLILSRLNLETDLEFASLSAGLKRRVLLARALVNEPDLLLLDEPTNHLDITSINHIEEELRQYPGTLLFVTHDRMFMQRLATRMVELDMGQLYSWSCGYTDYLQRKQADLDAEAKQQAVFDKKLAGEEKWIRQGIKARRTRNEGRVRALIKMRAEKQTRRKRDGRVSMSPQDFEMSGKIVIRAHNLSFQYDNHTYIQDFSTTVLRGDKIGIIGPNGSGKTTLLNLLLQLLPLQMGTVEHGTRLQTAYFDQLRAQLDPEKSVADNIAEGNDRINYNGQTRHIISYLKDFLFTPDRARSPVKVLSGGERNRLLLARLFAKPSNLLILDEPTNDLDTETLELLEELLFSYTGTVLLVSHDRAFLNNVVTTIFAFESNGKIAEYIGGYDDWRRQSQTNSTPIDKKPKTAKPKPKSKPDIPQKLSYKDQRELDELPDRIDHLEKEQQALFAALSDPNLYQQAPQEITAAKADLEAVEKALETAYERWEILEALKNRIDNQTR